MAAQMKPGERKQEGGGFWAGHGVGVQDGLWFGGSAQPRSVLQQGKARVGLGILGQLLTFFKYIFCGDFLGKGCHSHLTIITYI